MKKRMLIYLAILFLGVIVFSLYIFRYQIQKNIPSRCNQYSGKLSHTSWGRDTKKCEDAGCKVLPTETFSYEFSGDFGEPARGFKCVPFLPFENN